MILGRAPSAVAPPLFVVCSIALLPHSLILENMSDDVRENEGSCDADENEGAVEVKPALGGITVLPGVQHESDDDEHHNEGDDERNNVP